MKLNLLAIAVAAMLGLAQGATAQAVRVGVSAAPIPPYQMPTADGGFTGFEIDLLHAICEDQKLECTTIPENFSALIPELTGGKIDLILFALVITEKRKEVMDFSDKYSAPKRAVVGQKNENLEATKEGLAGITIGVTQGTTDERYAKKYLTESTIKSYPSQDEVNQDLMSGRIDATVSDEVFLQYFLTKGGSACCEVKGKIARTADLDIFGPGNAFGLRKGETELRDKINAGIKNIRGNGKYDEISKRYFGESIYGD